LLFLVLAGDLAATGFLGAVFFGAMVVAFLLAATAALWARLRRRRLRRCVVLAIEPPVLVFDFIAGAALAGLAGFDVFLFWANTEIAASARTITEVRINLFIRSPPIDIRTC
jgi:hypothetical protein